MTRILHIKYEKKTLQLLILEFLLKFLLPTILISTLRVVEIFSYLWRKQKTEKCHKFVLSVSNFSKMFVISTEMQQIGNKKFINRQTRDIICNTFDYMRITFPFEALTKIGFLRIYFFNLFSEDLNLPRHSFLRRL
jgi:hypothetical protein